MSGKLLLVSDLEGCAEMSMAKIEQSRFMCSPTFFEGIKSHLAENPENKVAFLGDYFDQGNMVVSSINGIMDVYNSAPECVTIIVGNRDVNKLRLAYEMTLNPSEVGDKQWSVWKSFYDKFKMQEPSTSLHTRLMTILNMSMGASSPKVLIDENLDEFQSAYLLLKIFSEKNAREYYNENKVNPIRTKNSKNTGIAAYYNQFINNCRNLFRVAKIVHYDKDYKTLMSHGGGMDSFFFHTPKYYRLIEEKLEKEQTYFDKMEIARRELMERPTDIDDKFNEETYNAPLKMVVSEILGSELSSEPPKTLEPNVLSSTYFLLQALGLKPDGTKHFTSFIQSCDNTGCKGPVAADSGDMYSVEYATFQDKLIENEIKVVASGHVPHCAPVPLIYKRSDNKKLIFILNDTSNGYRPASRGKDSAAITYVTTDGDKVGVAKLTVSKTNNSNYTAHLDINSTADDRFGFMFGEWSLKNAPHFDVEKKHVKFEKNILTFPARSETKPPGIFKPAEPSTDASSGGRRFKTRRYKKARKSKAKRTRKARKN